MTLVQRSWPPSPHDPRERVAVVAVGPGQAWSVRQFGPDDPKLPYFASRGFLHLQLWHAAHRISIRAVVTPTTAEVRALERWLVIRNEPASLRLLRTWWAALPARQVRA